MIICGWGVLILGIWSVLRFILLISMEYQLFVETTILPFLDESTQNEKTLITVITIAIVLLFSFIDVMIRFIIAHGAVSEGRGKPKKGFYVIVMLIYVLFCAFNIYSAVRGYYAEEDYLLEEKVAGLLMTVTDFVIVTDLFVATVSVRHTMRREGMYQIKTEV